ncbi:histone deacetylase family protein [Rhizobium rhizogenes]|uniref:histone deacetylase family protein n=1 Tax=Rhizobium rhizogenes TaxID=359 RepID=UPI001571AFA7|nr:histone deacetylase family protein [Rhizobium rhizogenes]NTF46626.1 histone deacetylase family protein [Rhizobium rhizogenes]
MLVVHHPDQALHDPAVVFRGGKFIDQPDHAERYRIFLSTMIDGGHQITEARFGELDRITEIHCADYIEFLRTAYDRWSAHGDYGPEVVANVHATRRMHRKPTELLGELGWYSNSTSCPMQAGTWQAVYASAQTALHGADLLQAGTGNVYALCRPPGHHAYSDLMSGMCFLNNAAMAAHQLTKRYGRVAIVDIDVHHGNGTQSIFWDRADVLFCSIHVDPSEAAPYYAGYADETGAGPGKDLNFNQPLPLGTEDNVWLEAVDRALAKVRHYGAEALVVSLGLDAAEYDPVSAFKITHDGFSAAGSRFRGLGLPTLLVQEGGYLSPQLGSYLRSFMHAF